MLIADELSSILPAFSGLIFLFIFLLHNNFLDKKIKKSFYFLLGLELAELIISALEHYTSTFAQPTMLRTVLAILGYTLKPILLCLILLLENKRRISKTNKTLLFIPAIINMLLCSTAFFTDIVFSYSSSNEFLRGPLGFITLFAICLYLILIVFKTIDERKQRSKISSFIIIVICGYILVSALIEIFFNIMCTGIAIVLGTIVYYIYFLTNIVQQKLEQENASRISAEKISRVDSLTGFYNKAYFIQTANAYLNNNPTKSSILLFIDIDKFKSVNDTYGHLIGDEMIIKLSENIKKSFRSEDLICRFGGDEFCVFLKYVDESLIKNILDRTIKNCCIDYVLKDVTIPITISIGGYIFNNNQKSLQNALKEADEALYKVKKEKTKQYFIVNNIL